MLILTEKPSVAKDFATTLNCKKNNGIYINDDSHIVIINCIGHLFTLFSPQDYNQKFRDWSLLPIIPEKFKYKITDNVKIQTKLVLDTLSKYKNDIIIIATDADREGEIIARECLKQAGITDFSNIKRFWVSEALTEEVIKSGLKEVLPLSNYNSLAANGFRRQHADWLVGMNFTRFITTKANRLLPVGRVQTAILTAIFNRCNEIRNFKSEKYYEYHCMFNEESKLETIEGIFYEEENRTRFSNQNLETDLKKLIGKKANLVKKESEEKANLSPQLYNLNALQKDSFRCYGYTAEQTLNIVQTLYEELKCVSYPRTPSRVMGERNVALCKSIYEELITYYPKYYPTKNNVDISLNNKRCFNDKKLEAHHALIPLKPLDSSNANEQQNKIYNLILERFMMAFLPNERENNISYVLEIEGNCFKIKGKEILDAGWKDKCYSWFSVNTNIEVQDLSNVDFNNLYLKEVNTVEKWTQAPKYFNEASIISFMENPKSINSEEAHKLIGLGTPATRHTFIPKLLHIGYIKIEKKNIISTELGENFIKAILESPLKKIANIEQTTIWEEKLANNPDKFYEEMVEYVKNSVNTELSINSSLFDTKDELHCPKCHAPIRRGKNCWYCTGYKNGCTFPTIWENIVGAKINQSDVQKLLSGKKTSIKHCKTKQGKCFDCRFILDNNHCMKMIFSQKN